MPLPVQPTARTFASLGAALAGGLALVALLLQGEPSMPTPDQDTAPPPVVAVPDEAVTAPPVVVEVGPREQVVTVQRGDTLLDILLAAGVGAGDATTVIDLLRPHFNPRDIRPGQDLTLTFTPPARPGEADGAEMLQAVTFQPDVVRTLMVSRAAEGGYVAEAKAVPVQRDTVAARMVIRSSLYDAAQAADIPYGVLTAAVRAFSYDVDFQRDIQPGDVFDVVYEHTVTESGEVVTAGPVVYARLGLSQRDLAIHRFQPKDGEAAYFDADGMAVRKTLLRTPLDAVRITSGFGMRRHPLLGYNRLHRGVDFGAPSGTPIYAAGDGTVVEAGVKGGYGNYIRIRHGNGVETAYAHLSRFAKTTNAGHKVTQGSVIGYVGSTGRSTGPHLHFEVIHNGEAIDPAKAAVSTQQRLAGRDMEAFRHLIRHNQDVVQQLAGMFRAAER